LFGAKRNQAMSSFFADWPTIAQVTNYADPKNAEVVRRGAVMPDPRAEGMGCGWTWKCPLRLHGLRQSKPPIHQEMCSDIP